MLWCLWIMFSMMRMPRTCQCHRPQSRSRFLYNVNFLTLQMARTQKNKATMAHLGLLKAKIAKLKRELIEGPKGSGGGGKGEGFDVAKSGDSRIGFVGMLC